MFHLIAEIDLSGGRTGDQPVHRVTVDPGGSHCIATVLSNGGAETYYMHARWGRPRILSRLKGIVVNAVAWNKQHITEGILLSMMLLFFVYFFPRCILIVSITLIPV